MRDRTARFVHGGAVWNMGVFAGMLWLILPLLQVDAPTTDETTNAIRLLLLVTGIGILSFGLVFQIGFWYLRGRDPHTEALPGSGGKPPSDLPAGVVGALLDERVDHHDLVASLFDMQRRGILEVSHTDPGKPGDAFTVTFRNPEVPLHAFERPMIRALFGSKPQPGQSALLADRARNVATEYNDIRQALYQDLVDRGYFRKSPEATRENWMTYGRVIMGLSIVLFVVIYAFFDWTAIFPAAALFGFGVAVHRLSGSMPRKTREGAEEAARWRAFQADLSGIAQFGDAAPALVTMEQHLPYALALGVSSVFVDRFSGALPVSHWANVVRDRVSEVDVSGAGEGLGETLEHGGDLVNVARHAGKIDLGSVGVPSIDLPSVGAPSIDDVGSASRAVGSGVQGASDFVLGLLSTAPDAGSGIEAASRVAGSASGALGSAADLIGSAPGALNAAGDLIGSAPGVIDAAGDLIGALAGSAPDVIDAVGGIVEVVDAAEVLEAAGSILGALLEGIGDL